MSKYIKDLILGVGSLMALLFLIAVSIKFGILIKNSTSEKQKTYISKEEAPKKEEPTAQWELIIEDTARSAGALWRYVDTEHSVIIYKSYQGMTSIGY